MIQNTNAYSRRRPEQARSRPTRHLLLWAFGALLLLAPRNGQAQIRVAVEDGTGRGGGTATVAQLNNDTYFDFSATLVDTSQIDTPAELANYDVVVLGGSGLNDADWTPAMTAALLAWVNSGGGVVATGWLNYDIRSGDPTAADLEALLPGQNVPSVNQFATPPSDVLHFINGPHPITAGLTDFSPAASFVETNDLAPEAGDTVLATISGSPSKLAVVVKESVGSGRSVYLGPIYLASTSTYSTGSLRSGQADRLLEQACAWASAGTPSACGDTVVTSGEDCDEGAANGSPTSCCTSSCTYRASGATCRPSLGACDLADTCTGSSGVCPTDAKSTSECRASNGLCDLAESCDGSTDNCPGDSKQPSTHVCRGAAGVCDVDDLCDGSTDNCPSDSKQPGTHTCRASNGVCDFAESCDGSTNDCPPDAKSSAQCRAANGVCDPAELCDGVNDDCPVDAKSTALCRAAAGICDVDDYCDGSGDNCPTDTKQLATHICRGAAGVCDVDELCDGLTNDCPADAKQLDTQVCRSAVGICDVDDRCDGATDDCPMDAKQPNTHVCRGAADICDAAELCDGSSNNCPGDAKQPSATVCRPLADECDIVESCDGSNDACPANAVRPNDLPCYGPNNNTCLNTCQAGVCSADFIANCCGNGTLEAAELCDDANQVNDDGCSDHCGLDVDSFQCYRTARAGQSAVSAPVTLVDQFNASIEPPASFEVRRPKDLCNPTSINGQHPEAASAADHLQAYKIAVQPRRAISDLFPERNVEVVNQYGTLHLDVTWPFRLLVPTAESLTISPPLPVSPDVDHFTCYKVKRSKGQAKFTPVPNQIITDQFGTRTVTLVKPTRLCLPTNKNNEAPGADSHIGHLLCYRVRHNRFDSPGVANINNQFGIGTVVPTVLTDLCIPSVKNPL